MIEHKRKWRPGVCTRQGCEPALPAPEDHTEQKSEPGGDCDGYQRTLANGGFELLVGVAKGFEAGVADIE